MTRFTPSTSKAEAEAVKRMILWIAEFTARAINGLLVVLQARQSHAFLVGL
jgi:hypothetical protein